MDNDNRVRPFELFEIDHETKEVCVALRADLADELGVILAKHSDRDGGTGNPCIFQLSRHIHDAVDVIKGRRRIEQFRHFMDVDVNGQPPQRERVALTV